MGVIAQPTAELLLLDLCATDREIPVPRSAFCSDSSQTFIRIALHEA